MGYKLQNQFELLSFFFLRSAATSGIHQAEDAGKMARSMRIGSARNPDVYRVSDWPACRADAMVTTSYPGLPRSECKFVYLFVRC